ncbi:RmlC-like jelly roll fold [Ostreococcus tauri]|jgi:mannose-6-phosphate isomerase-like protein (cupin superfamily)|uniref:RmlC-like jelly roll fold n=1 Tax=Ostreococcus tauri TaxID=70448 RepID=Q00UN3_OSTTA|nr:RmlC-like jelly roll fold [Ostreococcus tauri]OUS42694.1 hypothetical protein BE221DRAFT_62934 [Ostreococcus tauri]CAL58016.1 RmlC-like jelly roll fold [Ostreococcus tauri]|eukprot:XP_003083467.1 RmlC-like jelly roll fold [Ostreococcus tauri]
MRADGRVDPHLELSSEASSHRYPVVKIRAASLDSVQARAINHQATADIVKDLLRYDEVPQLTNLSHVALPPGVVIDRHVHPSKYEVFFVQSGRGAFKVWRHGARNIDEPREEIELKSGVSVHVGPEEPHEIVSSEGSEPLVMLYFGVVAPEVTATKDY